MNPVLQRGCRLIWTMAWAVDQSSTGRFKGTNRTNSSNCFHLVNQSLWSNLTFLALLIWIRNSFISPKTIINQNWKDWFSPKTCNTCQILYRRQVHARRRRLRFPPCEHQWSRPEKIVSCQRKEKRPSSTGELQKRQLNALGCRNIYIFIIDNILIQKFEKIYIKIPIPEKYHFQVEPNVKSMNKGDSFILDNGKNLYIYYGPNSKETEKLKASTAANQIRDQDHGGRAQIIRIGGLWFLFDIENRSKNISLLTVPNFIHFIRFHRDRRWNQRILCWTWVWIRLRNSRRFTGRRSHFRKASRGADI